MPGEGRGSSRWRARPRPRRRAGVRPTRGAARDVCLNDLAYVDGVLSGVLSRTIGGCGREEVAEIQSTSVYFALTAREKGC